MSAGTHAPAGTEAARTALARRYGRLLLAYPRDYRRRHGPELLATLLETSEPGRALPSWTESAGLVRGGLRTRATVAARGSPWRDGLHLGVLVVASANLALLLPYARSMPLWVGLSAAVVLAVLLGRVRLAIPLVALVGAKAVAVALGRPFLDQTLLPIFPDEIWGGPALYSEGGAVTPAVAYAAVLAGLLVIAADDAPLNRRSWLWWALVPLIAGTDPAQPDLGAGSPRTMTRIGLELALLLLAAWAGHVAGDPRWALAAGMYLLTQMAAVAENLSTFTRQDLAHFALLAFLTLVAAAVPYRTRTQPQF
ncbi:hypothetical protein GCM10023194_00390 [Planotetraspora phitsanulokensis]|uniref:Uncharacterized protein n=1 Tax=Planotetraspora phitsanulokensis TaxID=575192 RepID=A0A8J3XGE2_9ACTN|nr:hypothetical protein [Planotetraspora phitsanulokensis]GII40070.1 hypothetical protein Pph01_50730 [Planotetraspora phitsanulokensis]